jgi:hypothetical protein
MLACTQALDTSLEHEEATHKRLVSPNFSSVQEKRTSILLPNRGHTPSEPKLWRYVENVTNLVVDVMFDFVHIHECK